MASYGEGIKQITNISIGTLEQNNEQFTLWMQNGLEVGFLQKGLQFLECIMMLQKL